VVATFAVDPFFVAFVASRARAVPQTSAGIRRKRRAPANLRKRDAWRTLQHERNPCRRTLSHSTSRPPGESSGEHFGSQRQFGQGAGARS